MKSRKWLSFPYIIWMAIFIIIPLLMVIYYGITTKSGTFTFDNLALIADPINRTALWLSIKLSVVSTLICLVLAYPLALILNNMKLKIIALLF